MGMSIDKAIKMLEEIIDEGWLISDLEKCPAIDSCELAINIMRKYQKIQKIAEAYDKGTLEENDGVYAFKRIKEVVEDGTN